eukprot:7575004-Pyramimonas_sp.AAC.1
MGPFLGLGALFVRFLEVSWAILEVSWPVLGPSWASSSGGLAIRGLLDRLGSPLVRSWPVF